MRTTLVSLLMTVLLAPVAARAASTAESAAPLEDRPALKVREVERGLFFGAEGGGLFLFKPTAASGSGFSAGRALGISMGSDLGELASLSLMVLGTQSDTPAAFVSSGSTRMAGDFSTLILGATAKLFLLGARDDNGVKRFFGYVRGGAGLAIIGPKNFYPGNDVVILAGAGLEYFTRLRHISVGIDADFIMGVSYLGPGLMVSPNLRYTF